jgi:structural maintenance of chromosome 2
LIIGRFSLFGRSGSPYDFAAVDIGRLKAKARELEDAQKGMKNPKVINMIDRWVQCRNRGGMLLRLVISVEKEEVALTKMLSTVLKDKEKIEETIEELDQYKWDALQKAWEMVNG